MTIFATPMLGCELMLHQWLNVNDKRAILRNSPYLICHLSVPVSHEASHLVQLKTYLSEISRAWIPIDLRCHFPVSWQWMHENHVTFGILHDAGIDGERVFDFFVELQVCKTLLLYSCAVDDIAFADNLR